ncbi:DUF4339 domain-containing protein [Mariniblastus fucicola]|uniref:GYF domain-containing protein n=1 Tax=Mariniblastus fucicola TaxID=980251 RepID=A0A5B9PDI8_9BACT|nr:DUF4339 domain-containing protein [Mariniblastus fucicola]QEG22982.1 hypothetical protein MFFC18_28740 [Mariniblastus fucicola]
MGIRFHCNHCDNRLNVKAKQAGQFCICPQCESEIRVPLESTVEPPVNRKKKRHRRKAKPVEVDVSPQVSEPASIELPLPEESGSVPVASGTRSPSSEVSLEPIDEFSSQKTLHDRSPMTQRSVLPTELSVGVDVASGKDANSSSDSEMGRLPVAPVVPTVKNAASIEPVEESVDEMPESAFDDNEDFDSASALDDLLSSDERKIVGEEAENAESFLLAKPVVKVEEHPLKANPNLVWYLRHKRLGEKGPLKAQQIESMLESGQIREDHIVWREDWNDWLPAAEIFPELAADQNQNAAYEIPDELNPHSEANRKRRAQKRFWWCFSVAAFLLVLVLVYWLTQFGW